MSRRRRRRRKKPDGPADNKTEIPKFIPRLTHEWMNTIGIIFASLFSIFGVYSERVHVVTTISWEHEIGEKIADTDTINFIITAKTQNLGDRNVSVGAVQFGIPSPSPIDILTGKTDSLRHDCEGYIAFGKTSAETPDGEAIDYNDPSKTINVPLKPGDIFKSKTTIVVTTEMLASICYSSRVRDQFGYNHRQKQELGHILFGGIIEEQLIGSKSTSLKPHIRSIERSNCVGVFAGYLICI